MTTTVFLSYRRASSWQSARLVRDALTRHGVDVFMDTANIFSGEFEDRILAEICARTNFVVVIERGALDRIGEDGDWLRREIALAIATGRNVVPLVVDGCNVPAGLLPADVARLAGFNQLPGV